MHRPPQVARSPLWRLLPFSSDSIAHSFDLEGTDFEGYFFKILFGTGGKMA